MTSGNKFFFEEDAEDPISGVTHTEQADIFSDVLEGIGVSANIDSMEPMGAVAKRLEMHDIKNGLLHIEYGIVDQDYVIHLTPTHPKRNLSSDTKLRSSIEKTIMCLNKVVPFDLQVEIHLPRADWEIKVLSFIVRGAATAWNIDVSYLESIIIGEIGPELTAICNL